jgi:hypothetical protein
VTDFLVIAHGFVARSDLPIPAWLFGWAAALVLLVSFVGLATLWPEPRLQREEWRPLPRSLSRAICNPVLDFVYGLLGTGMLVLLVYAGFHGIQSDTANIAPTFIYVIFWVGLVPLSAIFGDVFRAFNPWRAIGRAIAFVARLVSREDLPAPLEYPKWLGRWPAVAGLFLFTALELVSSDPSKPEHLAIATLIYTALTFVGMALYGIDAWFDRGEAFSVYFNLFSRISPLERRGDQLGRRRFLSGLPQLEPLPGTVWLVAVMIGTVTFDGAGEGPLWTGIAPDIAKFFRNLGLAPEHALELAFLIGLVSGVLLIRGLYELGVLGARGVGGGFTARELAVTFAHTLVPIAFAYVMAHYFTFLLFQGQAMGFLASDPLGHGSNLFGTANQTINYSLIGSRATWYWQVAFVVAGHVAGLTLAHDRALARYESKELAVRSQYWFLAVMVAFTSLALWLLSQSNV